MPDEDIPEGEKIVADISQVKALFYAQKDLIVSLFDNLSITHEHLNRAAANMSSLCESWSQTIFDQNLKFLTA